MDDMPSFGKDMREKEFTFTEGAICINHGSYGAVPRRVQETQRRDMDEMNAFPDLWYRQNLKVKKDEARKCISEFINADPEDVVFVENATTAINSVLKSLDLGPEDIILCTDNTYGAVKITCEATVQSSWLKGKGVRVDYLSLKFPINSEDEVVDMYRDYFKNNTNVKMAVLDHITSPSAIKMPLEKLIPLCKEYGVLTMIDGAHAPGQIPLNLRQLDADFYAGNLHKWMYAPRGCAILHVKRNHHDWVKPLVTSFGYNTSFQDGFGYKGTRDDSPYCTVPEAIKFYNAIGGYDKILEYADGLLRNATELLTTSWKTERLPIPQSMEAPFMRMIELPELEGLSTYDEAEQRIVDNIKNYKIASQITCVGDKKYHRISANIYNTPDEYQKLCQMVLEQMTTA